MFPTGFIWVFTLILTLTCCVFLLSALTVLIGSILGVKFVKFVFAFFAIVNENGKIHFKHNDTGLFYSYEMTGDNITFFKRAAVETVPIVIYILIMPILAFIFYKLRTFGTNTTPVNYGLIGSMFICIGMLIKKIKIISQSSPSAQTEAFIIDAIKRINQGIRPRDLEIKEIESYSTGSADISYMSYLYIKFCHYLDKRDFNSLKPLINDFADNMPKSLNKLYLLEVYALLFYYSYIDKNLLLANNYFDYVEKYLLADEDINGKRIYAFYLYYVREDKSSAYKEAKKGLEIWDKFIDKGLAFMERDFLEELIAAIEADNTEHNSSDDSNEES